MEILKQTLDGQVASGGGDLGLLDFTRATGSGRAGSQAAERRRLLEALGRHCQVKRKEGLRRPKRPSVLAATSDLAAFALYSAALSRAADKLL